MDSDEDEEWDEILGITGDILQEPTSERRIEIPVDLDSEESKKAAPSISLKPIEITLSSTKKQHEKKSEKNAAIAELRVLRIRCHKIHTVALLANALTRNKWLNDPLLRARLMSLTPLSLQNSFTMITKKAQPDAAKRGRLFEAAIMRLTQWWYDNFETTDDGHIRSRTFDQIQKAIENNNIDGESGEIIRSSNSLMKHALLRKGCRDTNAQLFTALCRALDIPARLVVSLQSVPWQAQVGKEKPKSPAKSKKGKEKALDTIDMADASENDDDDDMEEIEIPQNSAEGSESGKGRSFPGMGQTLSGAAVSSVKNDGQSAVIRLRKSRPQGRRLGSRSSTPRQPPGPPVGGYPPIFWTEVFSRPDGRWIPVDPVRYIVNKRKVFEPPPHDTNNRMVYVVAIEEDGYARDVTPRYAKEYGAKTAKIQMGGKGRKQWWEFLMALMTRPFRLHRDDMEDEEFEVNQVIEGMPSSVAGFKDHPVYALERHLKRDEVIHPRVELGKFRGEPVYSRSNVVPLKTAENWMRVGRKIKEGCHAMKMVKQRAVTIHRRRVIEMAQQEGDEVLQGLYSEAQTELYRPKPIVDGGIPKNDFGNIDLYVSTMLPPGAAHVPHKRAAKLARDLGFDYAEAVTSFEFRKGRAFPILTGVVVAAENEEALTEACIEHERNTEEKELAKRMERVLKRWSRLIQGLRIRERLKNQYTNESNTTFGNGELEAEINYMDQPGGFLTEADAVVEPFHLPKVQHSAYTPTTQVGTMSEISEMKEHFGDMELETADTGQDMHENNIVDLTIANRSEAAHQKFGNPMSMRELAEIAETNARVAITSDTIPNHEVEDRGGKRANTPISRTKESRKPRKRRRRSSASSASSLEADRTSSPPKRTGTVAGPQTTNTRVLRPRAPKTAEQIKEAKEAEDAYLKAVRN